MAKGVFENGVLVLLASLLFKKDSIVVDSTKLAINHSILNQAQTFEAVYDLKVETLDS